MFVGCAGKTENKKQQTQINHAAAYRLNLKNTVDLVYYDQYTRAFNKSKSTLIAPNILAAPLNKTQGSFGVKAFFKGRDIEPMCNGYLAYDFNQNLVLLNVSGQGQKHSPVAAKFNAGGSYVLDIDSGKIKRYNLQITDSLATDSALFYISSQAFIEGTSVFNIRHQLAGMFKTVKINNEWINAIVPIQSIMALNPPKGTGRKPISGLRLKSDKIYTPNNKVKGFRVETTMGNFSFTIYDDLAEYKSNMIKLVEDGYYDSLLVHRVLNQFLVQMGAADTKYAKKGDPVGWRGPGYMQKTIIKPNYVHKRGAIALSKPPDYKNPDNLTSAGQFYVVLGRTFNDVELNDYEQLGGFTYTTAQRNAYKTLGGAAYLDSYYPVIGHVTAGLNVLDKMGRVPIDKDERPLMDIRIKKVSLLK